MKSQESDLTTEQQLWHDCLFVCDTSVLVLLWKNQSRDSPQGFQSTLDEIDESRRWIPHQVHWEFQRVCREKIEREVRVYDELGTQLRRLIEGPPSWQSESAARTVRELGNQEEAIRRDLERKRDAVTARFDVGEQYSIERLDKICRWGALRYEQGIPPGYMDRKKEGPLSRYGDLIIWFQTMDKARKTGKPIVFIINEQKEDWWHCVAGQPQQPRAELVNEMRQAGALFRMYLPEDFVAKASKYLRDLGISFTDHELKRLSKQMEKLRATIDLSAAQEMFARTCKRMAEMDLAVLMADLVSSEQLQESLQNTARLLSDQELPMSWFLQCTRQSPDSGSGDEGASETPPDGDEDSPAEGEDEQSQDDA